MYNKDAVKGEVESIEDYLSTSAGYVSPIHFQTLEQATDEFIICVNKLKQAFPDVFNAKLIELALEIKRTK